MKKFYSLIAIFTLFFSYNQTESLTQKQKRYSVSEFCEQVHKHKCFVRLLKKTIKILKKKNYYPIIAHHIKNNGIKDTQIIFKHPFIQTALNQVKQTKNLRPFFKIWHELSQFKFMDDGLIIKEFTQIILYVSKNILINQMSYKKRGDTLVPQINNTCDSALENEQVEQIVHIINLCTDSFELIQSNSLESLNELWNSPQQKTTIELTAFEENLYTEQCTLIYFLIQRLKYTYYLAKKLHKTKPHIFKKQKTFDTSTEYTNIRIKRCQTDMYYTQSLLPLLHLWKEFNEYRYINNPTFLQEFLCLTLNAEKHIVLATTAQKKLRIPIGHILALYNNIENLSIEELLNGIDAVAEVLPEIIEHYELNADMTWKDWAKKYWWLPVSIVAIGGKFVYNKFIKKNTGLESTTSPQSTHFNIPRPTTSKPTHNHQTAAYSTHDKENYEEDDGLEDLESLLANDDEQTIHSPKTVRNRSGSVVLNPIRYQSIKRKAEAVDKIKSMFKKLKNSDDFFKLYPNPVEKHKEKRRHRRTQTALDQKTERIETRERSQTIQPGTARPNIDETDFSKPKKSNSIGTPRELLKKETEKINNETKENNISEQAKQALQVRDRTLSFSAQMDGKEVELAIKRSVLRNLPLDSTSEEQNNDISISEIDPDLAPQPSSTVSNQTEVNNETEVSEKSLSEKEHSSDNQHKKHKKSKHSLPNTKKKKPTQRKKRKINKEPHKSGSLLI